MMKLNREQIIKALECCIEVEYCATCPATDYCKGVDNLTENALSLIKELSEEKDTWEAIAKSYQKQFEDCAEDRAKLTEENERLRGDIAKEFTCVFGKPHKVTDCPIDDEIAKAKADTVREIFDLVECAFSPVLVYEGQTIKRYIAELKKKYKEGG
jgi:hypothetical protein